VVVVYDGDRYIEEHCFNRKQLGDYLDVSKYVNLKEARFEHAPADCWGNKQPYEYRAVARLDGVWHVYDVTSKTLGLPELAKPTCTSKVTDPCPVDRVEEAASQDDAQPKAEKADESLSPATTLKSRTRR
jgi:hypothetical protein